MTRFVDELSQTDLRVLIDLGRPACFQPGEPVLREGEPGDYVVVVQSGQLKVTVGARLVGVRGPGELLGEMACLDGLPHPATVVAHGPVCGIMIAGGRFRQFLGGNPAVGVTVARQIITRLRAAERRNGELATHEIAPRLVRMLGELVSTFHPPGAQHNVEIPLSQHELAQLVNAAEVSTQRALRLLRHRRLVRTGYGKVTVPCVSCLDGLAGSLAAGHRDAMKSVIGCGGATHEPPRRS